MNRRSTAHVFGWMLMSLAAFAAVVAAASAAAETRLAISGAFHTTTSRAIRGTSAGCRYGKRTGQLGYESEALRIGRGQAVARVEFFFYRNHGRGRYGATAIAPYGRTSVQVVTARNATTGAASRFYLATSGSLIVLQAKNVGRLGYRGSLSGTVNAELRVQDGGKRIRLAGSWACQIEPTANG